MEYFDMPVHFLALDEVGSYKHQVCLWESYSDPTQKMNYHAKLEYHMASVVKMKEWIDTNIFWRPQYYLKYRGTEKNEKFAESLINIVILCGK